MDKAGIKYFGSCKEQRIIVIQNSGKQVIGILGRNRLQKQ